MKTLEGFLGLECGQFKLTQIDHLRRQFGRDERSLGLDRQALERLNRLAVERSGGLQVTLSVAGLRKGSEL